MTSCLWYQVRLRADQIAAGHLEIIRRRFVRAVARTTGSVGACLFVASQTNGEPVRQEAAEGVGASADVVFFSPAAISLIPRLLSRYGAEPCAPPDRGRAALLAGEARDWGLLPYASH